MLWITSSIAIPLAEISLEAIRSQGAGGQNVNKVSTAIHLRFAISESSLPDWFKEKLLSVKDRRITQDGIIVIKAQRFRSQDQNREDALQRLVDLLNKATIVQNSRRVTRPTRRSQEKRLDGKSQRGEVKKLRKKVK